MADHTKREPLQRLLSVLAHDLKTPLSGVIGALSVHQNLGDRLPAARRADLLNTALEEAQRLDGFITNLVGLLRLDNGAVLHPEWKPAEEAIQQAIGSMQHRLQQHPLTVNPLPPGIELCMDASMTAQALHNLLDNACRHTPVGTPVEISCRADEGYHITVRDQGPGLPPDALETLKHQSDLQNDAQVFSKGIGLAACKAIMTAQGGSLSAENHPEGGAVLTLCLPRWRMSVQATLPRKAQA